MERKMFDTPVLPRLDTILAEVKSGDLIIPWFQRPYVWDDERRLNLLDSIVVGMPIGSLLVWRTNRRDLQTYDSLGGVHLDGPRTGGEKLNYLIDGHQRISTLFGALYSGPRDSADSQDEIRWPLYYQLGSQQRPAFRVPPRRGGIPEDWLPLNILLDGDKLFDFTQQLRQNNKRTQAKEAERLANIFRDYIIPIVPLVTEELNVVTDAFVRINSQGKGMSEAHMLRALTHLGAVDTDKHFREVRASLEPLGWASLDDQVLVSILKAQMHLDVYASDVRGVHERLKANPAPLRALGGVLEEAIEFLATVGVRGPGALPYTYQLVTLATWAAWDPGIVRSEHYNSNLRRWFWISTYTEIFSGITGSRIRDVIDLTFANLEYTIRPELYSDMQNSVRPLKALRGSTGRTRAFLLFLAQLPASQAARERRQERLCASDRSASSLFPAAGASNPGNRVIAEPDELKLIRAAIKERNISSEMADEYFLPESAQQQLPDQNAFLAERQKFLIEREKAFLNEFGLVVSDEG
jgi:hypothetical protein